MLWDLFVWFARIFAGVTILWGLYFSILAAFDFFAWHRTTKTTRDLALAGLLMTSIGAVLLWLAL